MSKACREVEHAQKGQIKGPVSATVNKGHGRKQ